MAKTIKFNLMLDGNPVRTIEELKENFNVDDILWAYQNQNTLERWLSVRGFNNELEKLRKVKSTNRLEICRELISIFDVEKDEKEITESLYHIEASDQKENRLNNISSKDSALKEIIKKYHNDYVKLKEDIENKFDDYSFIKVRVTRIEKEFIELFKVDYWNYFEFFYEKVPLAILAILANHNLRQYFLIDPQIIKELQNITSSSSVKSYIKKTKSEEHNYLSKYIKCHENKTQGEWQIVEPHTKQCMILALGYNCIIRNTDESEQEIKNADIKNSFPILHGIDYKTRKSVTDSITLHYMEV